MPQSGVRECLTSYGPDLRVSVTQSAPFELVFPTHLTEQLMARMLWIFCLAHSKHFFTLHCGLHRYTFGCILSHVDRCILQCRVSVFLTTQKHLHRCTQSSLDPKHLIPSVSQQAFLAWSQGCLINTILLPEPSYYVCVVLLPALDCH